MNACNVHKSFQKMSTSLALFAMFVLPCTIFAQDRVTLGYHSVEDPGQRLISGQNFGLAVAFAFNPKRFNELWPHYGYDYDEYDKKIMELCKSGNRNIDIGRSAIARAIPQEAQEDDTRTQKAFVALPIGNGTKPDIVEEFLNAQSATVGQAIEGAGSGSDGSTNDFETLTLGDICGILSGENSDVLADANAVIVTQRPLPVSERYTYRLLEEGILAPGTISK